MSQIMTDLSRLALTHVGQLTVTQPFTVTKDENRVTYTRDGVHYVFQTDHNEIRTNIIIYIA